MATRSQQRRERRVQVARQVLSQDRPVILTQEGRDYLASILFEDTNPYRNLLYTINQEGPVRPSELVTSWGSRVMRLLGRAIESDHIQTSGPVLEDEEDEFTRFSREYAGG